MAEHCTIRWVSLSRPHVVQYCELSVPLPGLGIPIGSCGYGLVVSAWSGVSYQRDVKIAKPAVAIADRNPLVRSALVDILHRDGRFDIAMTTGSGAEFLTRAGRLADLGIIGWHLPDLSGGDILAEFKKRGLKTRLIVYAMGDDVLRQAARLGAMAVVSKREDPAVLLDAMWAVAKGRRLLPRNDLGISSTPFPSITARELELLGAVAKGLSNLEIASRFGISKNTVKFHLKNLYQKLDVRNRAMAVALVLSQAEIGR